jgi:hypothetical protein
MASGFARRTVDNTRKELNAKNNGKGDEMGNTTDQTREKRATESTSSSGETKGPGLTSGQAHEFAIILPLKPGGGQRMRERLKDSTPDTQLMDKMGTLHDLRFVLFDNDTRVLFASTYDGGFEQYIKDFATLVPDMIDKEFQECDGYPGVRSSKIWEYIAQYQKEAIVFYSAYPNATVRQVWKGQRVLKAFEQLLDEASS